MVSCSAAVVACAERASITIEPSEVGAGFVFVNDIVGGTIECPKHNGRFRLADGSPARAPVCRGLCTYPVAGRAGPTAAGPAGGFRSASAFASDSLNAFPTAESPMRSCGRLGPARLGSTLSRSSSIVSA